MQYDCCTTGLVRENPQNRMRSIFVYVRYFVLIEVAADG